MIKKLTRHGNSLALVIEKPVLDLMNIDEHTQLEISTDGARLIISPSHGAAKRKELDAWLKLSNKKYAKVFKALSSPQ